MFYILNLNINPILTNNIKKLITVLSKKKKKTEREEMR